MVNIYCAVIDAQRDIVIAHVGVSRCATERRGTIAIIRQVQPRWFGWGGDNQGITYVNITCHYIIGIGTVFGGGRDGGAGKHGRIVGINDGYCERLVNLGRAIANAQCDIVVAHVGVSWCAR